MSSVGQAVGGIIGGAVGFAVGGPTGALYGFQIGSGVGGIVDPPVVQGQQIGELAVQTSKEGGSRAIVFGTARPIGGNVIATTKPIIRKVKTKGGKGGPTTESETVHRTYAIGICEGPITGVRRIWRDGKLVYFNGRPDFAQNNSKFLNKATIFNGTFDQTPSAVLSGALGADVTAFRGTAYMVMNNEDLTNVGGRIPEWTFEVVRAEGFFLTSLPYGVVDDDALAVVPAVDQLLLKDLIINQDAPPEYLAVSPAVERFVTSESIANEDYLAVVPAVTRLALPPETSTEDYMAVTPAVESLQTQPSYLNWDVEGLAVTPAVTELTLT